MNPQEAKAAQHNRTFGIRVAAFVFGVLLLFTSLMRTIYLESAAVAAAYDTRRLRDRAAVMRNQNDVLRADIAALRNVSVVNTWAKEEGLVEVPRDAVRIVPLRDTAVPDETESTD